MINLARYELFPLLLMIHLSADFLLQNKWMSDHKISLRHPAAWIHGGLHCMLMLLFLPPWLAGLVALSHVALDTRKPLTWWRRHFRQSGEDERFANFRMWQDQAAHIILLVLVSII